MQCYQCLARLLSHGVWFLPVFGPSLSAPIGECALHSGSSVGPEIAAYVLYVADIMKAWSTTFST